ncbi:hypothetical protein R3P38DRAFT_649932 [Favolaschia claudopus]|uniref:Hypervirulence associated protein TUDOR domain-containing protein n=1 Tax=Favolaschia claudopus TaxID=2862362 RepID=A0AAW0EA78_9AGAR
MADRLEEGQEVSWKWGSGTVRGTVDEIVEDGKAQVKSNKGNTVSRNGRGPEDPAVKISRKGNDCVKLAHELNEVKSESNPNIRVRFLPPISTFCRIVLARERKLKNV